jgi:hypothetical protein
MLRARRQLDEDARRPMGNGPLRTCFEIHSPLGALVSTHHCYTLLGGLCHSFRRRLEEGHRFARLACHAPGRGPAYPSSCTTWSVVWHRAASRARTANYRPRRILNDEGPCRNLAHRQTSEPGWSCARTTDFVDRLEVRRTEVVRRTSCPSRQHRRLSQPRSPSSRRRIPVDGLEVRRTLENRSP